MGSIATHQNEFLATDLPLKDRSLLITKGLLCGKWISSTSGVAFSVIEPSSGHVLEQCADLSQTHFVEAIDAAHDGYHELAKMTAKERGAILRRWNDSVLQNTDDIALLLSSENGKTLNEAKGEVGYAASFISWFAEEATRSYGDTIPSSYKNSTVLTFKEPVGVCGIITPWNFPAAMITRKIAPAFAAGCSVVIKPPKETPFTALAIAKLALEAGIPTSCLHVIPTTDHQAAMELATHPKVKKLSFTGSTRVGKMLTKLASGTMKKVSMELDLAVEGALISRFRSSGQTCVCTNRILVQKTVVEEFTEKLVKKVKAMKLGKGTDAGITQGPLVNAAAVAKASSHVKDALQKGAQLKTGGKAPAGLEGYFYEPTVITGATIDMEVAYDETFGPLTAIFTFETEDEAVSLANDTEFGLAGYFYSKDIGLVMRVAQRMQCGMVGVNTGLMSAAETSFGGVKESGLGHEGSRYGIAEYQNIKAVTIGNLQD